MKWQKLGCVYVPDGSKKWARRRAYLPTPEVIDDRIRVYFSALDENWIGRVGFVDLDIDDPTKILDEAEEPVLDVGDRGMFDEHGVTPSCVISFRSRAWLYYYGWQRVDGIPPLMFTGLASRRGRDGHFERFNNTPILDRIPTEPIGRAGAYVIQGQSSHGQFSLWYNARQRWLDVSGNPLFKREQAVYDIRRVDSWEGTWWPPNVHRALAPMVDSGEFGLARPCVLRDGMGRLDTVYKMWYSVRSLHEPYRMGYAESKDGNRWERMDDKVGIERSEAGWDSEMICFPAVIDVPCGRLMFYNGNDHGETGFGVAILEKDDG